MKRVYLTAALMICLLLSTAAVFAAPRDKLIKLGMRGEDVQMVQKALMEKGFYAGEIDGIFGNVTLDAIRGFQISNGIVPDGVVGKETLVCLGRPGSGEANPSRSSRSVTMSASAYSAYDSGNSNHTYGGNIVRKGLVAVDPNVIPLGTRLFIPGYGYAIADDIGGSIQGNRIDLAFDSHNDAIQYGRQRVTVYILD